MLVELEPQPRSYGLARARMWFLFATHMREWSCGKSVQVSSSIDRERSNPVWFLSRMGSACLVGSHWHRVYYFEDVELACELTMRVFTFSLPTVSPRVFSIDIVRFVRYKYTMRLVHTL